MGDWPGSAALTKAEDSTSGAGSPLKLHVNMTHSGYEYQTSFDVFPDMRSSHSGEEVDPGCRLCGAVCGGPGHVWQHPEAPGELGAGNYPRTPWDSSTPFHPSLSLSLSFSSCLQLQKNEILQEL